MNDILQISVSMKTLDMFSSNAVVSRIAITPFRFNENLTFDELLDRTLYLHIDKRKQLDGDIDQSILNWWNDQDKSLYTESMGDSDQSISLEEAQEEIKSFLSRWRYNKVESSLWARNYGFYSSNFERMFSPRIVNPFNWNETKTFALLATSFESSKLDFGVNPEYQNAKHESALEAYNILQYIHSD